MSLDKPMSVVLYQSLLQYELLKVKVAVIYTDDYDVSFFILIQPFVECRLNVDMGNNYTINCNGLMSMQL